MLAMRFTNCGTTEVYKTARRRELLFFFVRRNVARRTRRGRRKKGILVRLRLAFASFAPSRDTEVLCGLRPLRSRRGDEADSRKRTFANPPPHVGGYEGARRLQAAGTRRRVFVNPLEAWNGISGNSDNPKTARQHWLPSVQCEFASWLHTWDKPVIRRALRSFPAEAPLS